jgi:hypothetical protein
MRNVFASGPDDGGPDGGAGRQHEASVGEGRTRDGRRGSPDGGGGSGGDAAARGCSFCLGAGFVKGARRQSSAQSIYEDAVC